MTKEEQINQYVNKWYKWMLNEVSTKIAKDGMNQYREDLLHHVVLDAYNLPADKINQMVTEDKLRWYLLKGCGMQLRSSTSPFYRLHRKEKMQSRENWVNNNSSDFQGTFAGKGILEREYEEYDDVIERLWGCFNYEIQQLHWYQRHLMERYWIQNMTLDELHKKYSISKRHLIKDINEALEIIREKCKDC